MQFVIERKEFCREKQQWVDITGFTEAEGGFGCAVDCYALEYECSMQNDCPVYNNKSCPVLSRL